nr:hypothetical protein [Tanacetum cinerariifolium]
MVKEEVKSQLPKEISDFATPLIKSTIAESYENVVLAKSFSQSKSTYEAVALLNEFELKKIVLDEMQDNKSYQTAQEHRDLYASLSKSYKLDRDLFETYGPAYSSKENVKIRTRMKTPPLDQIEGTSRTQHKLTGKSAHAKEPSHDSGVQQDQEFEIGINDDQPDKKNASKQNCLKIENLTQEILVRPAYNLLKGQVYPFDLSKPFPLIQDDRGRQVILVDYFINNDLEYLKVQKKLLDLEKDVIFDMNVALQMFTRRIIILKRVEDLQLGVESYHNKINITRPETSKLDIRKLTPYTAYNNPQ